MIPVEGRLSILAVRTLKELKSGGFVIIISRGEELILCSLEHPGEGAG